LKTSRENDQLNVAFDRLEDEVPDRVARAIRWLRDPDARWIRMPLGIFLILLSGLWFLPVIGIELLPIGLLLLAVDVPFLRKPVGKAVIWAEAQWLALKRWLAGCRTTEQAEMAKRFPAKKRG
jgi:hypothetical protein